MAKRRESQKSDLLSELTCIELLNSSPHDPLPTSAQPSLGYAFYDMAVSVLALLTDATNLYKMQMHRPVNTVFLYYYCVFVQKGI